MAEPLLVIHRLYKSFGALRATDDLSLDLREGELHALIGPNGAGKTTLIGQLSGEIRPDAGRIRFQGLDITETTADRRSHLGVARSFQITSLFPEFSALENVALAVQAHAGHSYHFLRRALGFTHLTDPARAALARVGLEARADVTAANLSHGEQRQLEIAMALATRPRLLLLDEPMAGMGPEESTRLVATLKALKGEITMLLVEHDMDAVFQLADRVTVLVYGRAIASGAPSAIRADPEVIKAYLGERHA